MTVPSPDGSDPVAAAIDLFRRGLASEALAAVEATLRSAPGLPEALYAQGVILEALGEPERAEAAYRLALERDPSVASAWINLGCLVDRKGQTAVAAQCYDRALMIDGGNALALANLGELYQRNGDLATARSLLEAAHAADPNLRVAQFNLARVRLAEHRLDEAHRLFDDAYRRSDPADTRPADAFLLSALCRPDLDADCLTALHKEWGARYAARAGAAPAPTKRRGNAADRPLTVGLLSGDFNGHPASRFLEPVFEHHDRSEIEIIAYHTLAEEDSTTARLRRAANCWRNLAGWSTERVVAQIEADAIDILLDLSGHTRGSRFDVLARRPAPLQGEWLGYLHASGLPTIDFRIGDALMDPAKTEEGSMLELPDGIWCYAPHPGSPEIDPGEAEPPDRPMRFGSFNNPMKINDRVLSCWARILLASPGATLTLAGFNHAEGRATVSSQLARSGIAPQRLRFLPKLPTAEYLRAQGEIDLALDPFPYGGGTTTFDSLWMGTPVLTMTGERACGRGSAAILTRLGLHELIANDDERYVEIALESPIRRRPTPGTRRALRARLAASAMCSGAQFCRSLENALRRRWLQIV